MSAYSTPPKRDGPSNLAILESILTSDFHRSNCSVEHVVLPNNDGSLYNMSHPDADKFAVVVRNLLTDAECDAMIDFTEEHSSYEPALLNDSVETDVRKSGRVLLDSEVVAQQIWDRITKALPQAEYERLYSFYDHPTREGHINKDSLDKPRATTINKRLRFLKYSKGDYFRPHGDGHYRVDDPTSPQYGDQSYLTLMLYLNDGERGTGRELSKFVGGQTRVWPGNYESDNHYELEPTKGKHFASHIVITIAIALLLLSQ